MARTWLLGLIVPGLFACARAKHHPRPLPPDIPVSARSTPDQIAIYARAAERIQNAVDQLYAHRIFTMEIPFRGIYEITRIFVRPRAEDRAAAEILLTQIIADANLQLECADALNDFSRHALAEDTIKRARRTRHLLDLPD